VSSGNVPKPNGEACFAPTLATRATGATIGRYRLKIITKPVAISHGGNNGDEFALLIRQPAVPSPSNAEPLFAEDEENRYEI
jgi:hypothetical protein